MQFCADYLFIIENFVADSSLWRLPNDAARGLLYAVEEVGCVAIAALVVEFAQHVHTTCKIVVVLLLERPSNLGNGGQTRQYHTLNVVEIRHILGPYVALNTDDSLALLIVQLVVRVERVSLADC